MDEQPIQPEEFRSLVDYAYRAHQEHATKISPTTGKIATMRQRGKVPFLIHPLWCALTLLHDTRVPWEDRRIGFQALLFHDVLEDTTLPLPDGLEPRAVALIGEMTCDTWEEEIAIENKEPLFYLVKLIDKLSTTYEEGVRPDPVRRAQWLELNRQLLTRVREYYPNSRTAVMAAAIIADTEW